MLCEACQAIFSYETPCFDTLTQHHGTLAAFQSAAASTCQICRMLWGRVPIDDPETLSAVREDSKTHYTLEERADKRIGLRIKVSGVMPVSILTQFQWSKEYLVVPSLRFDDPEAGSSVI